MNEDCASQASSRNEPAASKDRGRSRLETEFHGDPVRAIGAAALLGIGVIRAAATATDVELPRRYVDWLNEYHDILERLLPYEHETEMQRRLGRSTVRIGDRSYATAIDAAYSLLGGIHHVARNSTDAARVIVSAAKAIAESVDLDELEALLIAEDRLLEVEADGATVPESLLADDGLVDRARSYVRDLLYERDGTFKPPVKLLVDVLRDLETEHGPKYFTLQECADCAKSSGRVSGDGDPIDRFRKVAKPMRIWGITELGPGGSGMRLKRASGTLH